MNRKERRAGLGGGTNPYLSQSKKNQDYGAPESDHEGGIDSDEGDSEPKLTGGRGLGRGRGRSGRGGRGRGGSLAGGLSRKRPAIHHE